MGFADEANNHCEVEMCVEWCEGVCEVRKLSVELSQTFRFALSNTQHPLGQAKLNDKRAPSYEMSDILYYYYYTIWVKICMWRGVEQEVTSSKGKFGHAKHHEASVKHI